MKTSLYTALALTAFAANSILNKIALGEQLIDPASFTVIRLSSGILALLILTNITNHRNSPPKGKNSPSWSAAISLFIYAITFSYAYLYLDTGVGALILFGTVQITMVLASLASGKKLRITEWIGLFTAFLGFFYLVSPSLSSPNLLGFVLMTVAGVSWAIYTLCGKNSHSPLHDTTQNFLRTIPLILLLALVTFSQANLSPKGVILAISSGALASGAGYSIWYLALRGLTRTRAAVVQLLVPILAATGGVIFAHEMITNRLIISSLMVLGGIMVVFLSKQQTPSPIK